MFFPFSVEVSEMRGAHYLNRFFGGVGAEEQAGMSLEVRDDGAMVPASF